jgi:hypothetical protein
VDTSGTLGSHTAGVAPTQRPREQPGSGHHSRRMRPRWGLGAVPGSRRCYALWVVVAEDNLLARKGIVRRFRRAWDS